MTSRHSSGPNRHAGSTRQQTDSSSLPAATTIQPVGTLCRDRRREFHKLNDSTGRAITATQPLPATACDTACNRQNTVKKICHSVKKTERRLAKVPQTEYLRSMLQNKKPVFWTYLRQSRYVWAWLGIFLLFVILGLRHTDINESLFNSVLSVLPMLLLCVIIRYFLVPYFLNKHKIWLFYLLGFVFFAFISSGAVHLEEYTFQNFFLERYSKFKESHQDNVLPIRMFFYIKYIFLLTATFIATVITYFLNERAALDMKLKETALQQEIKYLKAQVNPHFLFNALNCIYSLAYTKDDKTPDSVLRLSEMMRYVIDDCQSDWVGLGKEIHYIENYISFQYIRMEHAPCVDFVQQIENAGYPIPPMILQPLIENCFKHSYIELNPQGYIRIDIRQKEEQLTFIAENSKPTHSYRNLKDKERIGIGINNIRQRLDLQFGNHYTLQISDEKDKYRVELTLNTPKS